MGKRTYINDSVIMALLYRKEYLGADMMLYENALAFDELINVNLDIMNSNHQKGNGYSLDISSQVFDKILDAEGKICIVLNTNVNLEDAWTFYVGLIPYDLLIASQMENALAVIGLEKNNSEIIKRNLKPNTPPILK